MRVVVGRPDHDPQIPGAWSDDEGWCRAGPHLAYCEKTCGQDEDRGRIAPGVAESDRGANVADPSQIELRASEFGTSTWFWISQAGSTLVSTSLHDLVRALKHVRVDVDALYDYLVLGTGEPIDPDRTLVDGIKKVPAGHTLRLTVSGQSQLEKYWPSDAYRGTTRSTGSRGGRR